MTTKKKTDFSLFFLTLAIFLTFSPFLVTGQVTYAQSITVITPVESEEWPIGSVKTIEWTSSGINGDVAIQYARNTCGEMTWITISNSASNTGSFDWTVNGTAGSEHIIKISSVNASEIYGQSAAFLVVLPPEISIVSPAGGEKWLLGSVQTIEWTSSGISSDVVIQYARNTCGALTWITISDPVPNTGSFDWTVNGTAGSEHIIKISSSDNPNIFDESELFLITATDTLMATGRNSSYQLGDGTNINKNTWTACTFSGTVASICATRYNSYVITDTDELWGIGSNTDGQLGLGHNNTPVTGWTKLADNVAQVAGGLSFTIYLATDGTVYTAGKNDYGQLGTGNNTYYNTWQQITTITNVKDVAAGAYHTLVTTTGNVLYGCGRNDYYQLGKGDTINKNILIPIKTGVDFARAGLAHTLIRLTTGALYACGYNTYGQIGLGSGSGGDNKAETPTYILSSVTNMGCGSNFSVLNRGGSLWAGGYNLNGELGFGYFGFTGIKTFDPVGFHNVTDVQCGSNHTVVLTSEDKVYTCGLNSSGQLNHGDNTNRHTLTLANEKIEKISASGYHSIIKFLMP